MKTVRDVMMKLLIMLIISLTPVTGIAQELKIVSFPELEKIMATAPEKPKLINFWATWCKPCVEELPYFIAAKEKNAVPDLQFIYVSVDFLSHTTKVKEMIQRLGMSGHLLQLNAPGGEWIDAIDKDWSGAIPYTLLVLPGGEKHAAYEPFENEAALLDFINQKITH